MAQSLVPIAYIGRTHGLKGALAGKFIEDARLSPEYNTEEPLYLEIDKVAVPFFLEWIQEDEDKFRLKFDSVHSIDEAQALVGKQIMIAEAFVASAEPQFEFLNYELRNAEGLVIGIIQGFEVMGASQLLEVTYGDKALLIPFNEELIRAVNREKKHLHLEIAEGLLDL